MSTLLARNWWAVGLRGLAGLAFALAAVLLLPDATKASFIMLFASYVAADGVFAIVAALRASRRTRRWRTLLMEGLINIGLVSWILAWPAIAAVALLQALSIWAIVTGGLMLGAAHRLSQFHGRWVLAFAGAVSTGWGTLLATLGPGPEERPAVMAEWLAAYAALFGLTLLVLSVHLRRRHRRSTERAQLRRKRTQGVTSGAEPP